MNNPCNELVDRLLMSENSYLHSRVAALESENEKLKKELYRVMQAAANGAYCRREHKENYV